MKISIPIIRYDYLVGNDHFYITQSVTMDWYGYSLVSFEAAEEELLKNLPNLNEEYFEDEFRFILNLNNSFKAELSHLEYQLKEEGFDKPVSIPYVIYEIEGHYFVQILFFLKMRLFYMGTEVRQKGDDHLEAIVKKRIDEFIIKKLYDAEHNFAPDRIKHKQLLAELKGDYQIQTYELSSLVFDFSKRAKLTKYTKEENGLELLMSSGQELSGNEELAKVAYPLNDDYPENLKPFLGQEEILNQTYNLLSNKEGRSFLVKGPFGSGKQSLIHQCIFQLEDQKRKDQNPENFKIWQMDPHALISGMSMVGQWENRIESILSYIIDHNDQSKERIILLFNNIVALIQGGKSSQNSLSFSKVLHTYIRRKKIQIVVLCTEEEWAIANEKDSDFMNLLLPIALPKVSFDQCLEMSIDFKRWAENKFHCAFHPLGLKALTDYVKNYAYHEALPGALFNRITAVAKKNKYKLLTEKDIHEFLNSSNKSTFLSRAIHPTTFKKELKKGLIGQQKAIETISNAYQLINAGFSNANKPLGSFLFIGPTGVGKTQAAKLIASLIHGNQEKLLRIDLNEYVGYDSVPRLIGSPYHGEGTLTRMVRNNPHGVLLLDEVEKAHPNVINLLLQVLDDARLTDYKGKVVSFSNLIIVMSSNLGAKEAASMLGFTKSSSEIEGVYRKAIYNFFKPEFINRIDEVVIFNNLNFENILQISKIQMADLLNREGFVRRNSILSVEDSALEWVAKRGYDDLMGGRGLKRQIEKDITALTAKELSVMNNQSSILLRVYLDDNKLGVNIIPFHFSKIIESLPDLSIATSLSSADQSEILIQSYELLDEILRDEREDYNVADTKDEEGETNTVLLTFYELQNKLIESKEELKELYLAVNTEKISYPLRLKKNENTFNTEANLENQISRLLKDYIDYPLLHEQIGQAHEYHNVNQKFLSYQTHAFKEGAFDHFFIEIKPVQFDQWSTARESLIDYYKTFMLNLGANINVHEEEGLIEVNSFGLSKLLSSEIGLHVFYYGPGKMSFYNLNVYEAEEKDSRAVDYEIKPDIIRLYVPGTLILDIQTNTICPFHLNAFEYQFLNYHNLVNFDHDIEVTRALKNSPSD